MAKSDAVWGIDIGQCALKAMRCRAGDDDATIRVESFDFIEYSKILSQVEAEPQQLIAEAIETFLSRNSVKGDRVAISVSGQSGLARFIKLPPVEAKKIPDIVKYEARQQIPFALEDVIWDYQEMAGGSEEEGFSLETEIGLFAMKREQVFDALQPFEDAGIDVEIIQLTPLALYNFVAFDQLRDLPSEEDYDPDDPPPSTVIISVGTDTTDLVVTDGFRVWQRNIPLGGSHFTKALSKDLKLTYAKAEHLKRNADQSEDPRAVYQAMRPIFSDLVTEILRSINYFLSLEKGTKINRAITMGNAMKLPGLDSYLAKYLKDEGKGIDIDVALLETFPGLRGVATLGAPAFKENQLSFGVSYGLALQSLDQSRLKTNLVPKELVIDRLIRAKKPWAVACVAALLLGCCLNFLGVWWGWHAVRPEKYKAAFGKAQQTVKMSVQLKKDDTKGKEDFAHVKAIGNRSFDLCDRRMLWAELYAAIRQCLPAEAAWNGPDPENPKFKIQIGRRLETHVMQVERQRVAKLDQWHKAVKQWIGDDDESDPPTGEGWVIQIKGHHFHNDPGGVQTAQFVQDNLIKPLREKEDIELPALGEGLKEIVSTKSLGISHPVLIGTREKPVTEQLTNSAKQDEQDEQVSVQKFDFTVQFVWKPVTRRARKEAAEKGKQGGRGAQR
jgi:type IV pilus assembly protein PilM